MFESTNINLTEEYKGNTISKCLKRAKRLIERKENKKKMNQKVFKMLIRPCLRDVFQVTEVVQDIDCTHTHVDAF